MYICPCITYDKNTFTTEALPMKNIVLIGMPGTGKSTVGKALADRLGYDFVDADDLIVQTTDKTLPEILRQDGRFDEIFEAKAGCTIFCHCGPGTLGVVFLRKS